MMRPGDLDTTPPTPSSPPGMTTSKSSKSSSFQSTHSDDSTTLGDVGNFEDIGLDDDDDNATLKSPRPLNGHRLPSPSAPAGRTLASSRRHPPPRSSSYSNLRSTLHSSNPRSTSLTVLTDPPRPSHLSRPVSPARRSLSNHSTSSLPLPGHRRRSPSPSLSANPRGPSLPPKPRRGSWQSNYRKSFAELEHECDEDEGDDIPDGLILDNVPISPRPQSERPPSRQPSVSPSPDRDRAPKERIRSVGNGTPPVAQAQGSLKSPTWRSDAANAERPGGNTLKSRAHSWNSALATLSAEAKALTEKLEEHADEEERARRPSASGRPNTWNSNLRSSDYAYDKKERVKSTPELPPLRRTHVMIDPLPVSKEKEAVLSRTRPSWLPPKDPAEERKHLRQYQKMMAASAKADERREAARRSKTELRDTTADGSMHVWEQDIIPRWNDAIRERRTREMWWRGVPPRSRGLVWLQAIGNELGLSESSFTAALGRAQELEARVNQQGQDDAEDARKAKWFENIREDVAHGTWKELRIFDAEGPLHRGLVEVLMAYSMYRSDIGYVSGCNTIAALLLLNLPSPAAAFIALANILNRPLPLSFYTYDAGAQASAYNLVLQILAKKSSHLHTHLTKRLGDMNPNQYLQGLFMSLFTGHLAIDEAARLWDVYVFEGDALLVRAAVAFLLSKEMALLGTKTADEVKALLAARDSRDSEGRSPVVAEVGAEERFIAAVREAGKI